MIVLRRHLERLEWAHREMAQEIRELKAVLADQPAKKCPTPIDIRKKHGQKNRA